MNFLKEHKFSILFLIIVLAVVGYFARGSLLKTAIQGTNKEQVSLDTIKNLIIKNKDCKTALPQLVALTNEDPNFVEGWSWQGVCQFQTGDLVAAKATFQKVLAMDPSNQPAQNYLKILNSNTSVTIDTGPTMTRQQFESLIGVTFDPVQLTMVRLAVLPTSASLESVAAYYKSGLSESALKTYITSQFSKAGIALVSDATSGTLTYGSSASPKSYVITTQKYPDGVYATIVFTKLK